MGGAGQAYLWFHRGPQRGAPVVAVDVIHNDEPVPPGFERVARDMCKGSSRSAYLCFRRQQQRQRPQQEQQQDEVEQGREEGEADAHPKDEDEEEAGLLPLGEIVLAAADEDPGEGFVRLEKPLHQEENSLFLCYKRVSTAGVQDAQTWSPTALKVRAL